MSQYSVPKEYFFPIHHCRPRFKDDFQNILLFLADRLTSIEEKNKPDFDNDFNKAIRDYPGNATKTEKTIDNWRTEISSLFGLIETNNGISKPGLRTTELALNQDLIEFFKKFLYCFQYPGAHIRPDKIEEQIEAGVHFKPAKFILNLLLFASEKEKEDIGLTKFEICHCIFNDLRCTRDNEDVYLTWQRIKANRQKGVDYDTNGDVIRYAGDIVDYMTIANLLVTYDHKYYYLNKREEKIIKSFINSNVWYSGYDYMIKKQIVDREAIKNNYSGWFSFVNQDLSNIDFTTDIISLITPDNAEYQKRLEEKNTLEKLSPAPKESNVSNPCKQTKKEIGDQGENLILFHERMKVQNWNRPDLIHLIKLYPNSFSLGYDIASVEFDETKRYIEVKTTVSQDPLTFNRFHLSTNEWNAAASNGTRYFVYRLMIYKDKTKLHLLQDPVGLYKANKISMSPRDGADITFDPDNVGKSEELLEWKK